MLTIMIPAFLVLLALGMPLAFAMGLSAILTIMIDGGVPAILLPQRFFSALDSFPLLAIPLYIFAGALMNVGGITGAIVALARTLVGHLRGGLAQVNILTSVMFSGISGSAAADTSAVGSMLLPAMEREGYHKAYSVVVTATSSIIGPIIPPSILMVLYGAMTGISIGRLFIAGVVPGLVIALSLMVLVYVLADRMNAPRHPRSSPGQVLRAARGAIPALIMPVLIVGGILSGVFTATEAGVIAVAYGMLYGFVSRSLGLRQFWRTVMEAAVTTGSVLLILGGAAMFSWILAREGFAQAIVTALAAMTSDPHLALLIILAALLMLGMLVETVAALILVVPVLVPIAASYAMDPVHFAIVIIMTVLIGAVTPPVAILVLIACRIGNVDYVDTLRPLAPFLGVLVISLLIVAFVPQVVLFLPNLVMGS